MRRFIFKCICCNREATGYYQEKPVNEDCYYSGRLKAFLDKPKPLDKA